MRRRTRAAHFDAPLVDYILLSGQFLIELLLVSLKKGKSLLIEVLAPVLVLSVELVLMLDVCL
jgi:hypothetical protein